MVWKGLPLLICGSGGISIETYNLVKQINRHNNQQVYDFLGFVEDDKAKVGSEIIDGFSVVTCDEDLEKFTDAFLVLGLVIPMGSPKIKAVVYDKVKSIKNLVYPNIIHPSVSLDTDLIELGIGNILTAGINLTCHIKVGNFNLINLNSTIGHDTVIGDFNVINPLVAVSGNVSIKNKCLVGTGAKILQQLTIEENVTIGAGAVVVKDIEQNSTVVGIPAKRIK